MNTVHRHTEGDWAWLARDNGAVLLVQVGSGHTVMDCVRKSMQACAPRFASWPGLADGKARAGRAGSMHMAHSWFDAQGNLKHPDARLIQASPALLLALRLAQSKLRDALASNHPAPLIAEAQQIQGAAIQIATGSPI